MGRVVELESRIEGVLGFNGVTGRECALYHSRTV